MEKVLSALGEHNCDPRRSGKSWSAKCPIHEDRRASLSISESDNGNSLLCCHAGCETKKIVEAIGLKEHDLFSDSPSALSTSTQSRQSRGKRQFRRQDQAEPNVKSHETAHDAMVALDAMMVKNQAQRVASWTYHDDSSNEVSVIVRYDFPTNDGEKQRKEFRPVSRHGKQWFLKGMPEPRPLYGLPDLAGAERVYITEGEKAAEAVRAIGLTSTTSAHGANSPGKTDWSTLRGKECVILPDNDEAGKKYAEAVTEILLNLTPPAMVKVVELPGLSEHGDIVDWREAEPCVDAIELRSCLEALSDQAETLQVDRPETGIERYHPFPTDIFPQPIREFVEAGAKAIGCDDTAYLAVPMLSVLGAAIGNSRRIRLKRTWTEPPIIWTAIVGNSGSLKSPALELASRWVREIQRKAFAKHDGLMADFRDEMSQYERDMASWKKKSAGKEPPEMPGEPVAERYWCDDITVEALALLLRNRWRGLLMVRDELAGWLENFGKYSSGKGSDVPRWLEMFGGRSMMNDRKTGGNNTVFVPRAAVCVTGGIQLDVLRRVLRKQYRENGLAARLLMVFPPQKAKQWSDEDIDPHVEAAVGGLLDRLYQLPPATDEYGDPQPVEIGMTPEAKEVWIAFYNEHALEQAELSGDLAAAWSKLEGYAARFSLVIHLARSTAGDTSLKTPEEIDRTSIEAGIRLTRWFNHETRRIYAMLDEDSESCERRQLIEWIERKGGAVSARDVQIGNRRYRTAKEAETALTELEKAGCGRWKQSPAGKRGRPSRQFVLPTVYGNTPYTEENSNSVDVDSVDASQSQDDD